MIAALAVQVTQLSISYDINLKSEGVLLRMKKIKCYKSLLPIVAINFSTVGTLMLVLVLLFQPRSNTFIDFDHFIQFGLLLCLIGAIFGLSNIKNTKSLIAIVIGLICIVGFLIFAFKVLSSGA